MIEFIYFDLGNVLVSFDSAIACRNLAKLCDVSTDLAHRAIYESGLQQRFEQGELDGDQFADRVNRELSLDPGPVQELLDAISDMFQPVSSMRAVLDQVRDAGFGVGLLSNTCLAHWDWILRQRYPVMEFSFDETVLSFEVGSMKPDAAIYRTAETAAGVAAETILFLDDRDENVLGARDRGWQAEQCVGGQSAIDALRRAGVLRAAC